MSDETRTLLDVLPEGEIKSPPFDWKGSKLHFRLLSTQDEMDARHAGQQWAHAILSEQHKSLTSIEVFQLMEMSIGSDTLQDCHDIARLWACLCAQDGGPASKGSDQHDSYRRLAERFSPLERQELTSRYLDFVNEHDPSQITDEQLEEMIAAAGKSQDISPLMQHGSNSLRICLHFTARRLADALVELEAYREEAELVTRIEALEAELERVTSLMSKSGGGSGSPSGSETGAKGSGEPSEVS